jgi:hypothetical protein
VKLPDRLREALDETGLPWEVVCGGKHHKVKLAGKLVAVYPHGKAREAEKRSLLNTITQVRRAARELRPT